jgi:hypothetical protein
MPAVSARWLAVYWDIPTGGWAHGKPADMSDLAGDLPGLIRALERTTERVRTYERTAHAEGLSFSPTRCALPTPLLEEDDREREGAVDIAELIGPSRGGT